MPNRDDVRDDVFADFIMEEKISLAVLKTYLQRYPEYTEDLLEIFNEIKMSELELAEAPLSDLAWARPAQPQPGDTGAVLAAILKAMAGPKPIRDIRLTAALVLEPRLLVPLLSDEKAAEPEGDDA